MPISPGATLIDSNIFIQAKNFAYRFDFCKGFWDWILLAHNAGHLYSCKKVLLELKKGDPNDPARVWAESLPASFFLDDMNDAVVMTHYASLMNWAISSSFTQAAIDEFADHDKADAFLIAIAMSYNLRIATQEKLVDSSVKKRIPIPNAAHEHGVSTEYIYDMLSRLAAPTFALKP